MLLELYITKFKVFVKFLWDISWIIKFYYGTSRNGKRKQGTSELTNEDDYLYMIILHMYTGIYILQRDDRREAETFIKALLVS